MNESMTNVVGIIRRSLSVSARAGVATCLPTLLLRGNGPYQVTGQYTSADAALAYYCSQRFDANRTRMDTFGYPGMLRDLNSPPPWVEIEPDDVDGAVCQKRLHELRPLVEHAQDVSEETLVAQWKAMRDERCRSAKFVLGETSPTPMMAFAEASFRQLLSLAKVLGTEKFEVVWRAVFDFDEFTPAAGVPDLLVWLPKSDPALWFFSEVKGPRDSLRATQKEWLYQHWGVVAGHFLLTILD